MIINYFIKFHPFYQIIGDQIIKNLQENDMSVLQIPSIEEITNGKASIDNLRPITIEDLLGRDSVKPDPLY